MDFARPALVVLGCRLVFEGGPTGILRGAAVRRVLRAADAYRQHAQSPGVVIASGGRAWGGVVEADAIARELERHGVPAREIVRERWSHSTRDNARFTAELLRARNIRAVEIVTCSFHVARATALFEHEGLAVRAFAAAPPRDGRSLWARLYEWGRERVATYIDREYVQGAAR